MTGGSGVLLDALGEDADRLHPTLRAQMSSTIERQESHGVFARAGSRLRRLNALGIPVVGRDALVSGYERDVPFTLVTVARRDGLGRATLDTTREFGFRGGVQCITDRLVASSRPGLVRNVLGRAGRIELILRCDVTEGGALRMRSERVAVRLAGRRFALRGILRLDIRVEDGWDAVQERRTIRMSARSPIAGTVLEYRGWYRVAPPEDRPGSTQ
ncbi:MULTISPECIES: DUF4166 domain-containing protein [unclassified Microbacterium]|uniref:DUF4166 domain-containing protein n=1 Tax=unclassified Microbacterium TaxID=2609290 RepID=UPI0034396023